MFSLQLREERYRPEDRLLSHSQVGSLEAQIFPAKVLSPFISFNMSPSVPDDTAFNPDLYLSPNEQGLLLTALNSNKRGLSDDKGPYPPLSTPSGRPGGPRSTSNPLQYQQSGRNSLDNDLYASPVQQTPGSGALGVDESPYLDYDLDDVNFDWDINGDQMIGSLPGTSADDDDADLHDKRKASDDDADDHDGGGKRREGDDKTNKKPGRKPLTSEPTSVSDTFPLCRGWISLTISET